MKKFVIAIFVLSLLLCGCKPIISKYHTIYATSNIKKTYVLYSGIVSRQSIFDRFGTIEYQIEKFEGTKYECEIQAMFDDKTLNQWIRDNVK